MVIDDKETFFLTIAINRIINMVILICAFAYYSSKLVGE